MFAVFAMLIAIGMARKNNGRGYICIGIATEKNIFEKHMCTQGTEVLLLKHVQTCFDKQKYW